MEKIRIGVIGVGYLGRIHTAKYAQMDEVELVGVADINKARAVAVAQEFGTRVYGDYHELLKRVDAVSVVVPTKNHFEVADCCLENGVDVLIEKPMTTTLEEADRLIAKAEMCNRIIQVGHIEQYNPAVMAMKQYLTKPVFIESDRIHTFKERGVDVDVVLDLMIHDIDIILSIVDSPVKSMHSVGVPVVTSTSDIANTRIMFENGCTANVTVSRISKMNVRKLRIFQPRSYISVDYGKKEILVIKHGKEFTEQGLPKEEILHFCFAEKDALETELKAFLLNVRQRTTPTVNGKVGRRALKAALQIIQQMKDHAAEHQELLTYDEND